MLNETDALIRRVEAAIWNAGASRAAVEHDWPECHRKNCQGSHPSPDGAFTTMKVQISRSVRAELEFHSTTRPDLAEPGDTADEAAIYTLCTLLNRYTVHDAGTFIKAARLIIEAYPALVPALTTDVSGEARS